jgi:hypothetical protein
MHERVNTTEKQVQTPPNGIDAEFQLQSKLNCGIGKEFGLLGQQKKTEFQFGFQSQFQSIPSTVYYPSV